MYFCGKVILFCSVHHTIHSLATEYFFGEAPYGCTYKLTSLHVSKCCVCLNVLCVPVRDLLEKAWTAWAVCVCVCEFVCVCVSVCVQGGGGRGACSLLPTTGGSGGGPTIYCDICCLYKYSKIKTSSPPQCYSSELFKEKSLVAIEWIKNLWKQAYST